MGFEPAIELNNVQNVRLNSTQVRRSEHAFRKLIFQPG